MHGTGGSLCGEERSLVWLLWGEPHPQSVHGAEEWTGEQGVKGTRGLYLQGVRGRDQAVGQGCRACTTSQMPGKPNHTFIGYHGLWCLLMPTWPAGTQQCHFWQAL